MDVHAAIGRRIRQIRKEVGLSQAKLADLAATSVEYVSRVERGRRGPSVLLLQRLAVGLGVPLKELFEFEPAAEVDVRAARGQRVGAVIEQADDETAALLEEFVVRFAKRCSDQDR